jgi:class 3 adenylate cyclase
MFCGSCRQSLPTGARFCPSCGAPSTDAAPGPVIEERKLVTVVFCDLVGSTELSERLDPETLRSVILRYFAAVSVPIEHYGGTVEKFIGDAVMAVFGVPRMREDDAARAAAAALAMLAALEDLNADLEPAVGVRLRVRIGVNTGPAVTSVDVSARQALVSGETVNVAARLEQNAGHGEILLGLATRRALGAAARTESVGALRLKGKSEPVRAYRLLELTDAAPEAKRRFDLPLVGRAGELAELDSALERALAERTPVVVTMLGEPGIGKTRLVRSWLDGRNRALVRDPGVSVGAGRCRSFGDHASLAPLAEAVRRLLADVSEPDPEAMAALESGLLSDGTPGASLEVTCAAVARILACAAPAILVLDDCQWASETLLDVLERVSAAARGASVLIIVLARLELLDRHPRPLVGHSAVTLAALGEADCRRLVDDLVGSEVDERRRADMIEASGGNPFHLEQLVDARRVDTESEARRGQTSALPQSLQALLGARIDALAPPERTILDLAAVLGREFGVDELATLSANEPEPARTGLTPVGERAVLDPVAVALARLSARRFVEPWRRADGAASFRFSNGLICEAAYLAMVKRVRADRHERAADVVTGTATAAMHVEQAYRYRAELGVKDERTWMLRDRAARLLAESGAQALRRSDLVWSRTLLERALTLSDTTDAHRGTVVRQLGEIKVAQGAVDEGRALFREVLRAAAGDRDWGGGEAAHARLALAVTDPHSPVGAAARAAGDALPVFAANGDDLGLARSSIRIAQYEQFRGCHRAAVDLLLKGVRYAERCAAEPELALALGAFGISLWRGPTPVVDAIAHCRELLARYGGPRPVVATALRCPLAVLLALDDQTDAAREVLDAATGSARTLGYAETTVALPVFGAAVEIFADRREVALGLLDQAAQAAHRLRLGAMADSAARESARLLLDLGRPDEAADRLAAPDIGTGLLNADAADLDGLLARLAAVRGDLRGAEQLAERSVTAAAATDSPIVAATADLDRAAVLELAGDRDRASVCLDAAADAFLAKGHRPGARRVALGRARLGTGSVPLSRKQG